MRKFGLKLWSSDFLKNIDFTKQAEKALKEGEFDYLELFALPSTFEQTKNLVKSSMLGLKIVIHAPHSGQNLDIGNAKEYQNNCNRIKDSQLFADMLQSDIIIIHPGMQKGEQFIEETICQLKKFNDRRLTVENLPDYCSQTKNFLHGVTPKEIKHILDETKYKFCFDFSHAICGANSYSRDIYKVLAEFKALNPAMYHLCDGDDKSTNDSHLHYGEGNYNLRRLVTEFTTEDALITMETGHGLPTSLEPWKNDINYIKKLIA